MKHILFVLITLISATYTTAQTFDDYFADRTLRIDYVFSGNAEQQIVALDELES